MSRSGYSEDGTEWELICWRGAVKAAIRGKRGQVFLHEFRDALDALPDKKLCHHDLQRPDGACCAIGAVGKARGIDMTEMDPDYASESGELSKMFNIANAMVREIEYENDECEPFWWADNVRNKETGFPLWEKDENGMRHAVYKTNDSGQPINEHGLTKEQFNFRTDELRWSRMRLWVDEQITVQQKPQ